MGDGDGAQTREQRGREPDGIGDGTPPRTGRRGGKRLRTLIFEVGLSERRLRGRSVSGFVAADITRDAAGGHPSLVGRHGADRPGTSAPATDYQQHGWDAAQK